VYEWDEAKREANLRKHRLDFWAAHLVYENPEKITYRLRSEPESRLLDIALVELKGAVLALYYSQRERSLHLVPICLSKGKGMLCRCQIAT
jgi:hypothetical protein